jgi:dTDP-4-dehydrorhamnose 3,5-epimerase
MIEGVQIKLMKVNQDERGDFTEILKINEGLLEKIAQASVSTTKPGVIKAFHWHKNQEDFFYVLEGNIHVVLYDPRESSLTKGITQEIPLGNSYSPSGILIPGEVLHGYKVVGSKSARVLYLMNNTYDPLNPDEQRVPHDDLIIGFNWDKIKCKK